MQCRVTTEDPANSFMPDYGRICALPLGRRHGHSARRRHGVLRRGGHAVLRFAAGQGDGRGPRFVDAARRMERCLQEFRVRGVKTNIPFLINLVTHPEFLAGGVTTRFIDETPELFQFAAAARPGDASCSRYLGEMIVNGNPLVKEQAGKRCAARPRRCRDVDPATASAAGHARQAARSWGRRSSAEWMREQKPLLLTDTTFRDAHQSLLATRMRTYDMLQHRRRLCAACHAELFSLEMWGGATFDTVDAVPQGMPLAAAGRAARADSQHPVSDAAAGVERRRLRELSRQRRPGVRARRRRDAGIDVFRIFDSLNWVPNMRVAMDAVLEDRRDLRSGHLLHGRHPRSEAARSTT